MSGAFRDGAFSPKSAAALTAQLEPLPGILQEIAEVAGRDAALAVAEAKGGQDVFIVARLKSKNWLVRAVGLQRAQLISGHFTSGQSRQKITIPAALSSAHLAEKRRREARIIEAIERGDTANQIAEACGVHIRTVRRWRSHLRRSKKAPRS